MRLKCSGSVLGCRICDYIHLCRIRCFKVVIGSMERTQQAKSSRFIETYGTQQFVLVGGFWSFLAIGVHDMTEPAVGASATITYRGNGVGKETRRARGSHHLRSTCMSLLCHTESTGPAETRKHRRVRRTDRRGETCIYRPQSSLWGCCNIGRCLWALRCKVCSVPC